MSQIPVLIVGAGPTGLMLSLELSMHSIPHRIIDAATTRSPFSRALVIHSRSLELLARHEGLIEELIPLGKFNMAVRIFANKKLASELDVHDIEMTDTRFPTPLLISQAETEKVLESYVRKHGIEVERGLTAEQITQSDEDVKVTVKSTNGDEELISCQYVVGCDGAHSAVRRSTDLSFDGDVYPQDFILADLRLTWSLKNTISFVMGNYGLMGFFPMKDDVWRVLCSRVQEMNSNIEPTITDFEEAFVNLLPQDTNVILADEPPIWMSRFRLHHRIVNDYRQARCFLAGDAAHIHSPAGGQGMNTGIQDSVNLAWKLAAVIRGERDESLLDTYNIERHRIGKHLLDSTDRGFKLMATSNPVLLWLRNTLAPWILLLMDASQKNKLNRFRFVSQLGIRYRHSPIVGQGSNWKSSVIRGGNRLPDCKILGADGELWLHSLLRDWEHHLLVFSGVTSIGSHTFDQQSIMEILGSLHVRFKTHLVLNSIAATETSFNDELGVLHNMLDMSEAGVILTRPDGYTEWIGNFGDLHELVEWIATTHRKCLVKE